MHGYLTPTFFLGGGGDNSLDCEDSGEEDIKKKYSISE